MLPGYRGVYFKDEIRHFALVFFALGIAVVAYYYILYRGM